MVSDVAAQASHHPGTCRTCATVLLAHRDVSRVHCAFRSVVATASTTILAGGLASTTGSFLADVERSDGREHWLSAEMLRCAGGKMQNG